MNKKVVFVLPAIGLLTVLMAALVSTRIAAAQPARICLVDQSQTSRNTTVLQPQKWEYRIIEDRVTARLEREANRLGEQGYEIFAFKVVADAYFVMVLKRPKA